MSGPVGRRGGGSNTRTDIVDAARACFAEDGYDKASMRAIARRAGVDPALVHHCFDKAELFMATVNMRHDPSDIFDAVHTSPCQGEELLRAFLQEWEPLPGSTGPSPFVTIMQALCSSTETVRALREFLTERVWSRQHDDGRPPGPHVRQALITSQLWGVAVSRYVLGLEPLTSATIDEVADCYGPILQATFDSPSPPGLPWRRRSAGAVPKGRESHTQTEGAAPYPFGPQQRRSRIVPPRPDRAPRSTVLVNLNHALARWTDAQCAPRISPSRHG